jgi:hypothetical protein
MIPFPFSRLVGPHGLCLKGVGTNGLAECQADQIRYGGCCDALFQWEVQLTREFLVTLLVFVAGCSASVKGPATGPVSSRSIAEVRTYADLLGQPAVALKSGLKVHLGIESARPTVGEGMLLYCLIEDLPGNTSAPSSNGETLGVLGLNFRHEQSAVDTNRQLASKLPSTPRGPVLFARSIHFDRAGGWRLTLLDEGEVLRQMEFSVSKEDGNRTAPPWLRLTSRMPDHYGGRIRPVDVYEYDANPAGRALPMMDGTIPIAVPSDTKLGLPKLLPEEPDANTHLEWKDGVFVLQWEGGEMDGHGWLARWWINGKPYTPEENDLTSMKQMLSLEGSGQTRLRIHMDGVAFGLHDRDRVAVQLLYSADGTYLVNTILLQKRQIKLSDPKVSRIRLTNKVEFEYQTPAVTRESK